MVRSWDVASDLPEMDVRPTLAAERRELVELLSRLDPDAWMAATTNAGWNVHDVALHLLGNDMGRIGWAIDGPHPGAGGDLSFETLAASIEEGNDRWVGATRRISPALLPELLALTGARFDVAVRDADLWAPGIAVGWTGTGPSPVWLDLAREYTERWVHHAQIRLAIGEQPLLARRWLHPVLDTFVRCLPRAYRDVPARLGALVVIQIEDEAGGVWHLRRGSQRWHLVPPGPHEPRARVRLPADVAWRLFSRTVPAATAAARIAVDGDPALAEPATRALAVMTTRI